MGVQRGITSGASQVFVISVRNVRPIFLKILFGEPKVDDVDFGRFFPSSNHKVIWLDIPMKVAFILNVLNSLNHLVTDHERGFEVKSSSVGYK